jgi:nickel/cobalt transporter (NicO) family protein
MPRTLTPRLFPTRRLFLLAGLLIGVLLLILWALGGWARVEGWAMAGQRQFQTALAGALRALRAGDPGALSGLLLLAFGYGVLHAAGPGHGKFVIGSYGVARQVALLRLTGVALAAALMQASVAVALVYGGLGLLGWTKAQLGTAETTVLAPLARVMLAGIGLWLVWRGLRGLWRQMQRPSCAPRPPGLFRAYHTTPSTTADNCPDCGHRHGPSLHEVQSLTSWKETLVLILAIGARPCSGALMLLVLTWQIGLSGAGIAGAYAMAIGTGLVTVAVAALSVWAREGARAGLPGLARLRLLAPVLELLVGLAVVMIAARMTGAL